MKSTSAPFSYWRFVHNAFICVPRTIHGVEPMRERGFRQDYEDAMAEHCVEHISRDGGVSFCCDAFNVAVLGA